LNPLIPFDKLMAGFDKALLSVVEGLRANGFTFTRQNSVD
jgi:hypothetical protein